MLLPEPDSPTRPSTSPFAMSKLTSSTARTGRSPWPKYFLRPRTASIGALAAVSIADRGRVQSISQRMQRERWPAASAASGGIAAEHSGSTSAQRGANAHPGSGSSGLATWPGIAFSRRRAIVDSSSSQRAAAGTPAVRACTDAAVA